MSTGANSKKTDGSNQASDITRVPWPFIVLSILAGVAFWGTFAYAMWSGNEQLARIFGTIISVGVGVFITFEVLHKLYKQLTKE